MGFNPQEYITKIKGKDYLEVKWRLVWFRDENPVSDYENSLRLKTTIVEDTGEQANVRAELFSPAGELLATAHKREHKKEFYDYMEKAETGAIGRVLAIAGYGTQFAEELELPDGKVVDAPVAPKGGSTPTPQPRNNNAGANSDDEKERRKQEAIARAKANAQKGSANSQTNNSKPEPTEQKQEAPAKPESITDGQKKAVQNLAKIIARKRGLEEFDLVPVLTENFGKNDIEDLTNEEGIKLIQHLNQAMKG